jgi:hypothetical protein
MSVTRKQVSKGMGGLMLRRLSDNRLMWLTKNVQVELTKTETEGEKVQGVNKAGSKIDLDVAGKEVSYEVTVTSNKNTMNLMELLLDAEAVDKANANVPWGESGTVTDAEVTLKGGTPVDGSLYVTYDDGSKLTEVNENPTAGQFVDNGDGTVSFHADDNDQVVVFRYLVAVTDIKVQGGDDFSEVGELEMFFYQITGTTQDGDTDGVDIIWMPRTSLSGEADLTFSDAVPEKTFTLTGLIPTSPTGWSVPYKIFRNVEIDTTNSD